MKTKPNRQPASGRTRILLVDDHAIVREGFCELINGAPDLVVCGEAATLAEAMDGVSRHKPDVVLVDLSLQDGSGLELIKNLKAIHPMLPMLVLSTHDEAYYAERAVRAGALGYVMKRENSQTVLQAIRTVLGHQVFLSKPMRERMLQKMVGGTSAPKETGISQLSDREMEVFQLIGEGQTTRQVARKLHLSLSTVETHRTHIKEKLNLENATELMRAAVEWNQARVS